MGTGQFTYKPRETREDRRLFTSLPSISFSVEAQKNRKEMRPSRASITVVSWYTPLTFMGQKSKWLSAKWILFAVRSVWQIAYTASGGQSKQYRLYSNSPLKIA